MLGVRDSVANVIVLAESGPFPLQLHWWQQVLKYHRIMDVSDTRLIRGAFLEGMHNTSRHFWSHKVHSWLQGQSPDLHICDDIDVSVIENAKIHYALTWHQVDLSSVVRYTPLQPE